MRHLAAKEAGIFSMVAARRTGIDARNVVARLHPGIRESLAYEHEAREFHWFTTERISPAACGRVVSPSSMCRETHRRNGHQRLAPLPDFCSPSCPDCAVILDRVEEARAVRRSPIAGPYIPPPPRDYRAERIARKLAKARRR